MKLKAEQRKKEKEMEEQKEKENILEERRSSKNKIFDISEEFKQKEKQKREMQKVLSTKNDEVFDTVTENVQTLGNCK